PARRQYRQPQPVGVGGAPNAPALVHPISAATCPTGRPGSITRRAAYSRNSGVYVRRLPDIRTSFPRDRQPHHSGVHHQGSTPILVVGDARPVAAEIGVGVQVFGRWVRSDRVVPPGVSGSAPIFKRPPAASSGPALSLSPLIGAS